MNTSKTPKLIAVDCDGTLFDTNGYPSPRTSEVVQRLVACGHQIVAATGRSRFSAVKRLESVPGIRHLVCSNGAYGWDVHLNCLSWDTQLAIPQVEQIVSRLREAFSDVAFNWEARDGFASDESFIALAGGITEIELGGQAQALCSQALYKLKVRRPGVAVADLQREQASVLGEHLCEITNSGAPFTELSAFGAHKGSGVAKTAVQLGFNAADTLVFGDNHNDLPMFRWAGTAIAMGNALEEVKSAASAVTSKNSEHGVADYLEKLLDAGEL